MQLLPAEIEAIFATHCDFGTVQLISSRRCGVGGKKLVLIIRNYQVCDGHFRWVGRGRVVDLTECLPQ